MTRNEKETRLLGEPLPTVPENGAIYVFAVE